jgi:hypothetical protein
MEPIQRTPITHEDRQAAWRFLEQSPRTEYTALTLLLLLQLMTQVACGIILIMFACSAIRFWLSDCGVWKYVLGAPAVIIAGIVGLCVGCIPWDILRGFFIRRQLREIKDMSDDELWRTVDRFTWGFISTTALVQLAARGRDVSRILPRLIRMLDTSEWAQRRQAISALRLVFFDEARIIADYDPGSYADCRAKIARLREALAQESNNPADAPPQ